MNLYSLRSFYYQPGGMPGWSYSYFVIFTSVHPSKFKVQVLAPSDGDVQGKNAKGIQYTAIKSHWGKDKTRQ